MEESMVNKTDPSFREQPNFDNVRDPAKPAKKGRVGGHVAKGYSMTKEGVMRFGGLVEGMSSELKRGLLAVRKDPCSALREKVHKISPNQVRETVDVRVQQARGVDPQAMFHSAKESLQKAGQDSLTDLRNSPHHIRETLDAGIQQARDENPRERFDSAKESLQKTAQDSLTDLRYTATGVANRTQDILKREGGKIVDTALDFLDRGEERGNVELDDFSFVLEPVVVSSDPIAAPVSVSESENDPLAEWQQIMKEILSTEERFASDLDTVVKILNLVEVDNPLFKQMANSYGTLEFLSKEISGKLKEAVESGDMQNIADIYSSPEFDLYVASISFIVQNYTEFAGDFRGFLSENVPVLVEIQNTLSPSPEDKIIVPVQRMPRHILLLSDLIKAVPEGEKGDLPKVLSRVGDLTLKMNASVDTSEGIKLAEYMKEMASLQDKVVKGSGSKKAPQVLAIRKLADLAVKADALAQNNPRMGFDADEVKAVLKEALGPDEEFHDLVKKDLAEKVMTFIDSALIEQDGSESL